MDNEKKKIAFFVQSFPVISETFIMNQIVELIRAGHQVDIFASHRPKVMKIHDAVHAHQILEKVTYLDSLPLSRVRKLTIFFSRLIRHLNRRNLALFFYYINYLITFKKRYISFYTVIYFLDKPSYDIVHSHYGFSGKLVTDLRSIGLMRHAKLVTTFHGYDFRVEKGYYEKLFQSGDVFTVNTKYSLQKLHEIGCPEHKIKILPVGFDSNLFTQAITHPSVDKRIFTLIFIGRLYAIKAPDVFIDICRELKETAPFEFRAFVIGEGDMFKVLEEQVQKNGLNQQVNMLGSLKQSEIHQYLQLSDVFVLTGREIDGYAETQGLVVQEAQAMGVPVVVSNIGGIAEGILPEETGFAIQELNAASFAAKIIWLHNHPEERKKMGDKAREFSRQHYTSETLNQRLIDIYQGR